MAADLPGNLPLTPNSPIKTPQLDFPELGAADSAVKAELTKLATCGDEELLKQLPGIVEDPESLACLSENERTGRILTALRKREQPDVSAFRQNLLANMERVGAEKRQDPMSQMASARSNPALSLLVPSPESTWHIID